MQQVIIVVKGILYCSELSLRRNHRTNGPPGGTLSQIFHTVIEPNINIHKFTKKYHAIVSEQMPVWNTLILSKLPLLFFNCPYELWQDLMREHPRQRLPNLLIIDHGRRLPILVRKEISLPTEFLSFVEEVDMFASHLFTNLGEALGNCAYFEEEPFAKRSLNAI